MRLFGIGWLEFFIAIGIFILVLAALIVGTILSIKWLVRNEVHKELEKSGYLDNELD